MKIVYCLYESLRFTECLSDRSGALEQCNRSVLELTGLSRQIYVLEISYHLQIFNRSLHSGALSGLRFAKTVNFWIVGARESLAYD